jgi:MarR-like DNA-binding transcriptional regulator SgrR of sgrS sRNA
MHSRVVSLDPREWSSDPAGLVATEKLAMLLFDRLICLDEQGRPKPQLAASWEHDAAYKRWQFQLRPGVKFHDASPLSAPVVAGVLEALGENYLVSASDGLLVIQADSPAPDLLSELALARRSIFRRSDDGALLGTGPFRLSEWQPNRKALLTAFEDYWGGRPFVDAVEIEMGVSPREQLIAFELGRADLVEILPADVRRAAQNGRRISSSSPVELMALLCAPGGPAAQNPRVAEAIALSIDRASILSVLLQRQGDIAGSLLPQWMSGYAFLFSSASDAARARELWSQITPPPKPMRLDYDPADPLAQFIVERIALNAREAGILLQVGGLSPATPTGQSGLRLARIRLKGPHPAEALADLAQALGLEDKWKSFAVEKPDQVYAAERKLMDEGRIIPLFHLPEIVGLSPRLRNWMPRRWGEWRLADAWLAPDESAPQPKAPEKP